MWSVPDGKSILFPCLQSKSGIGELQLVCCSEALGQHLSVYSGDFGLIQSLTSKHYIFCLSPLIHCHVIQ